VAAVSAVIKSIKLCHVALHVYLNETIVAEKV